MVTAHEILKNQEKYNISKQKSYNHVYEMIEKKIQLVSNYNSYYIWYQIPEFLLGMSIYNIDSCKKYIVDKLKNNKFKVVEYSYNILLISWFP